MSCSCCCCVSPSGELLEGIRKKERLVRRGGEEEEEEAAGEEEENRRNMDISLLREQYRCTRERQKRHTQVLLFRTVSEELSEAVSIVPVTQGLTSPWKPSSSSPPGNTSDANPTPSDPWHVHLGLHRRSCPGVTAQLAASSPDTTDDSGSTRWSSPSFEAAGFVQEVDLTSDPPSSSRDTSPCSSFSSTKEEDHFNTDGSREDPDTGSPERSRGDPEKEDPVQVSVSDSLDAMEQNPCDGSEKDHPDRSFSDPQGCSATGSLPSSDESSTPVASVICSPSSSTTSLQEDLKENQSAARSNRDLQDSSTSVWGGCRKLSAPALRFTRQLSAGGMGSSTGVHQNQNYHPFPNRKTPRISEAARRLGMYSSF